MSYVAHVHHPTWPFSPPVSYVAHVRRHEYKLNLDDASPAEIGISEQGGRSSSHLQALSLESCLLLLSPSNKHQVLDMCFLLVLTGLMLMERKIRRERNLEITVFTSGEMALSCKVGGEADREVMTCCA